MKNIIIKSTLILSAIFFASCNRDEIAELNNNPSFPTEVEAIYLMPSIEAQMALGIQFDSRFLGKYTQYFSHATAGDQWDLYGYNANSDAAGEIWKMAYFSIGKNLSNAQAEAEKNQRYDIVGIMKIIRAWTWQTTTDYSSNLIKFDQVFTQRLTFDYGTQEEAYAEVVRLAKEGILDLQRTDGNSNTNYTKRGDLIYDGDKARWIKFAYGLLARNANNLINKPGYDADVVIGYVDNALASNADNTNVKFNGVSSTDSNFYGPIRNNLSNYRQSDFVLRTMDGTIFGAIDPRMANTLVVSQDGVYRGNKLNNTASTVATTRIPNFWGITTSPTITTPGRYLFRNKAPFPLMTYVEMQFIKAEAAFKKGDKPTALAAYTNGISASIDMVNSNTIVSTTAPVASLITPAQKTAFLSNTLIVPTNPASLTISQIMLQKYVALFGYGYLETWTDMRKHHYDTAVYQTFATNGLSVNNNGNIAYRVRPRYNSEYVWNFAALQAIGGDQIDYHTQEMWFSQP